MQRKPAKRAAAAAGSKSAPRKSAAKKTAPPRPKNILTAGIRALSDAHEQVVARQGRVFESLLGLGGPRDAEAPAPQSSPLTAALDPFGFRKFEDVFDQRVARSLEHLDVPKVEAFAALQGEVERLQARISALEAAIAAALEPSTRKR